MHHPKDGHVAAPTLAEWEPTYFRLRAGEIAPRTILLHRDTFRYLVAKFGAGRRLDQITPADADDWTVWLRRQPVKPGRGAPNPKRCLSEGTVRSHVRRAKVIFKRAAKRRHISENPFAEIKGTAPRKVKDWYVVSREQLEDILRCCPTPGWRALLALCRLAGLRRGEALRLEWKDINWERRTIQVLPQADEETGERVETTKQAYRQVPIEPRLYEILRECHEAAPGPECMDYEPRVCPIKGAINIDRALLEITAAAGVPKYSKPFHALRKALESEWLEVHPVMDVCTWLGHSPLVAAEFYHRTTPASIARVTTPPGPRPGHSDPANDGEIEMIVSKLPALSPEILAVIVALVKAAG